MQKKLIASMAVAGLAAAALTPMAASAATKTTKKKAVKTTKKAATTTAAPTTAAPTTAAPTTAAAQAAAGGGKKGGTFVSLQLAAGDPDHVEPGLAHTIDGSQIANSLFDGLMEIDYATSDLKPAMAESFSLSPDGKTVTFKLKKNAKFHNGEPVLPSNFKCGWERAASPDLASEVGYHLDSIVGKSDIDDGKSKTLSGVVADDAAGTLTVKLKTAYSSFVAETQHTVFSPLTKKDCAAGKDWEQGIMIGNGPFKMNEPWKHDQYIKLVRNDDYYGGHLGRPAYLDSVEFRISKDPAPAYNLFESGTGDNAVIPGGKFKEAAAKYGEKGNSAPQLVIQYYGFNWTDKDGGGFANAKLRQAISLAIDRNQINQLVFNGTRSPATGVTPPGVPGYKAGLWKIKPEAQVEEAKKLLAEWGKPLPKISLRVNSVSANLQVANIVKDNLSKIGIEVELDPKPSTGYFSDLANKNDHQLFRTGWVYDYVGYDNGMYPLLHTETVGADNASKFSNAQFDALVNQARSTPDLKKQADLYQQAEKIALEQAVVIPLIWGRWNHVVSSKVDRYPQSATGFVDFADVSFK
jgi:oligopeptide transport system substrate-binding protein